MNKLSIFCSVLVLCAGLHYVYILSTDDFSTYDHYQVLRVDPRAPKQDITKSFRSLSLIYHPDKNPNSKLSQTRFNAITSAYSTLSDPTARKQYDLELQRQVRNSQSKHQSHEYHAVIETFQRLVGSYLNVRSFVSFWVLFGTFLFVLHSALYLVRGFVEWIKGGYSTITVRPSSNEVSPEERAKRVLAARERQQAALIKSSSSHHRCSSRTSIRK